MPRGSLPERRSTVAALVFAATFVDILAYSVAVPVLPDMSARLGASPTIIGFLFASFGVTALATSIPMGALSDRVGRRLPMVAGLALLSASSLFFAYADRLGWLFFARMVQGAADAVTWVVGLALVADLYGPEERGRITGLVMSGPGIAFMIGPSIGGFLYEAGGIRLPFIAVGLLALLPLAGFLWLDLPVTSRDRPPTTLRAALSVPAIVVCMVVVVASAGTITMLEPVVVLWLAGLGIGPGRAGLLFGVAALVTASLNPVYGRLADRLGARWMMLAGLVSMAIVLPLLGRAGGFNAAVVLYALEAAAVSLVVVPSLSFMAQAAATGGTESFGLAYGLYNVGWGVGLLAGPAAGGALFERLGFTALTIAWTPLILIVTVVLARTRPDVRMRSTDAIP